MDKLPQSFCTLNSYEQFIVYRVSGDSKKKIKQPANHETGTIANAHDSQIWTDSETAIHAAKTLGENYGVGFVLTDSDPFFLLDIDSCINDSVMSTTAQALLAMLDGAAVETSTSRNGLHILGSTRPLEHTCRNLEHSLELYTSKRFIALTGIDARGDIGKDCTEALDMVIECYFDRPVSETVSNHTVQESSLEDDEVLQKALSSKSAKAKFGHEVATFKDLWEANEDVLSKVYPADTNSTATYNASSADMALAMHLVFWCGGDQDQILRLMCRSALAREKWNRSEYLLNTITRAMQKNTNNYAETKDKAKDSESQQQGTYISIEEQRLLFANDVYVLNDHSIFRHSAGKVMDKARYDSWLGGHYYRIDDDNAKTVRSAFDALTRSAYLNVPKVDDTMFLPALPSGDIITIEGRKFVNVYAPLDIKRKAGDITPFLNHLKLLWPDSEDQKIALSYLASLVQFQGYKFPWCIVIQGTQGNGKSFIGNCLEKAIGEVYTQKPNSGKLTSKFNDWLDNSILAIVEDFHTSSSDKFEVMELMKPLITEIRQEVEGKGKKKLTKTICTNFIFTTNNADALQKHKDDRRFCMLFTAQQSVDDLQRDGMGDKYFVDLHDWAHNKDGFAIITDYLFHYDIPRAYNPMYCTRAPKTSTTDEAIYRSLGNVEHAIIEATEEYRIGFRNDWINTLALREYLKDIGLKLANKKLPETLERIGYIKHPGLKDGRPNNPLPGTTCKPRLYIHKDSDKSKLTDQKEIIDTYLEDQK
jgi:primase-polymerase (primpol)-like protein